MARIRHIALTTEEPVANRRILQAGIRPQGTAPQP